MRSLMLSRVEVMTNCEVESPVEADFALTEYRLFAVWRNASSICGDCAGTDESHYLSCSVWDAL
jgi:hypothetical protein